MCQDALSPKILVDFGLSTLTPQNEFPMMFNMFVNMVWRAELFGYMWVPFELGSFNNLRLVFSLE